MKNRWPLRRISRLRRINPERKGRLYVRNYGGPLPGYDHAAAIRGMRCAVDQATGTDLNCSGPIDAAHVRARGMGGAKGSWKALVPLCRWEHHRALDQDCANDPKRFEAVYLVDLEAVARKLSREAIAAHVGEASERLQEAREA